MRLRAAALVIALATLAACLHTSDVVRDGIDEWSRRINWQKLREPARELATEIARGALDAGDALHFEQKLDAAIDRFVRSALHAASEELDGEVSPAMARAVRATVDAGLASLLGDGTVHRIEELTDALAVAAMAGIARGLRDQVAPAIASAIDRSLGPAMQRAIQDHLGPAFAATLSRDLTPVLVDAARRTSAAAGEGLVDGVRSRAEPLIDREIERLQRALDRAEKDAQSVVRLVVIAVLGALAGVLAIALWLRHRTAAAARAALRLVTREIGRTPSDPMRELAGRIKAAGEGSPAGAFLAQELRTQPSFKLTPTPPPWER